LIEAVVNMKNELLTIRSAEISDYTACLPLFELLYHNDIGPNFREVFKAYTREGIVLLAEALGRPVGLLVGSYGLDIDWEGRTGRIDAVVVDENRRMEGIGRKLVQRFIESAREHRCKAVKSRINVANAASQKFHEELGFSRADTREYMLGL
jgi:N-acetylglutamate synthase-like GNAT family acetyltransferase